ncbi:hypothetical protein [Aestuariibacter sp. GS-14]|nr:hypothetical protein [Aestuariibacter sp. GS-14]
MSQQDSSALNTSYDDNAVQDRSIVEELADAKQEIRDLKMKIMWMERHYE